MGIKIRFSGSTVKELGGRLQAALRRGDGRLIRRITAMLWLADGLTVAEIADRLGVSRETVYAWVRALLLDGLGSLGYRTSPGRPPKLAKAEKRRLKGLIAGGPEAAGYPTGCWNSALVQDLIAREFGALYLVHMNDRDPLCALLRNLGFTYQKARFVSDHLDPEVRRRWLDVEWPQIVREARRRGAMLLFADEVSFAQWGSLGYTWAVRGQQPTVLTTGKRKGYKVFGLIDYFTGRLFHKGITEKFNAERYCEFLKEVLVGTTGPVIVIQDGAKYHTAAYTRSFVAAHAYRLTVYRLPSYSPDYNPIEHLWRNIKRGRTHNRYFPTFESLTAAVEDRLDHLARHPQEILALMATRLDRLADAEPAA